MNTALRPTFAFRSVGGVVARDHTGDKHGRFAAVVGAGGEQEKGDDQGEKQFFHVGLGVWVEELLGYQFGYPDGAALRFALLEIRIVKRSRVGGFVRCPVAAHADHGVVLPPDKYAGHQSRAGAHLAAH